MAAPKLMQQPGMTGTNVESSAHQLTPASPTKLHNRASQSISPYVQSHADSPVAWQLLDDEAIARAKRENKLIFLNIGFKACHCKLDAACVFASGPLLPVSHAHFLSHAHLLTHAHRL